MDPRTTVATSAADSAQDWRSSSPSTFTL